MELFETDPGLVFEKIAATELEEDPTAWPRQVLTELYRTIPEISDYVPEVSFVKIDEEQGFGLGVVVVTNATNSSLAATGAGDPATHKALIPVIVKGHTLCPMDVLMSVQGKMYPLTADRLREVLFRPESFEMMTDDWGDTSLWNMFFPPGRGDASYGSGTSSGLGGMAGSASVIMGSGMKTASTFAMLQALSGTLLEPDVNRIAENMDSTPGLLKAAASNLALLNGLKLIGEMPCITKTSANEVYEALESLHPAEVVQLSYSDILDQYWVKSASRTAGYVHRVSMDRGQFLKFAGDELTKRVDTEGTLTVAAKSDAIVIEGPDGEGLKVCERPGFYTVYGAARGDTMHGWVIPGLLDGKGNRLPIALFTNGKVSMTQDQIAVGSTRGVGERCDMPDMQPKGTGCFWYEVDQYNDKLRATIPVAVRGCVRNEDGSCTYQCTDITGEELKITLSRGAKGAVVIPGTNELILPHSAGFVGLGEPVALVSVGSSSDDAEKLKSASAALAARIKISAHGDETYSLHFSASMPKLAGAYSTDTFGHDEAAFALCRAGLSSQDALNALAYADQRNYCTVPCADIGSIDMSQHTKTAGARVAEVHALKRHLLKEAAVLPDVQTVDTVLSLGFVNSENVKIFISRIPYLEKSLTMICEFILASRLGLTEIPESAASRCARALNDVIQGLKALALREIQDVG